MGREKDGCETKGPELNGIGAAIRGGMPSNPWATEAL